jgi:ankyrin repeat protein
MNLIVSNYSQQQVQLKSRKQQDIHDFVIKGDLFNLRFELNQLLLSSKNASLPTHNNFNINNVNPETGRTALIEAVANGYYEIVKYLIEDHQCNVNKKSVLGRSSALHAAVEFNHRQIAIFLILNGANIDAIDKYENTALHLVNTLSMAKMLHKFEADCLLRNNDGNQPSRAYKKRTDTLTDSSGNNNNTTFDQTLYYYLSEWEYTTEMMIARNNANHD